MKKALLSILLLLSSCATKGRSVNRFEILGCNSALTMYSLVYLIDVVTPDIWSIKNSAPIAVDSLGCFDVKIVGDPKYLDGNKIVKLRVVADSGGRQIRFSVGYLVPNDTGFEKMRFVNSWKREL